MFLIAYVLRLRFAFALGGMLDNNLAVNSTNSVSSRINFWKGFLPSIAKDSLQDDINTYTELSSYSINSVVLDTNGVATTSFDRAIQEFIYLDTKAYIQTMQYLINHSLFKGKDYYIEFKDLIADLYKKIPEGGFLNKFLNIFSTSKSNAFEYIINFATEEYWKGKSFKEVLENFIKAICPKKSNGKLDFTNPVIQKFISKLNSPDTPKKLKLDVMSFLNINFDTDPKGIEKEVQKFSFTQWDFEHHFDPHNMHICNLFKDVDLIE